MDHKLSLSELNLLVRDALHEAFPETVWVVAEVSELKENRSGHCYLELVEKDEESEEITARSRATIWSYTYRMLKPYFETTTGQPLSSGLKVLVQASVEFHQAYGFSLNIKDIDPAYTVGDMARKRAEIINRLKAEGVFEMNREIPLPEVPQKIAVISSATAAGYQDFINQLENNPNGFKFYPKLFEAYMQGTEAAPSIIRALERIFQFDDFFDAVVIIRGGGAQADLSCFDNYDLALNISQFPLPVFTGIGHEKDDTIVDLIAHTRLKTPTAVAEFLIAGVWRFYENLLGLQELVVDKTREILDDEKTFLQRTGTGFSHAAQYFLLEQKNSLTGSGHAFQSALKNYTFLKDKELGLLKNRAAASLQTLMNNKNAGLKQYSHDVKTSTDFILAEKKNRLAYFKDNLRNSAMNLLNNRESDIIFKQKTVRLLTPENILKRGYTLTWKNGKIIKSKKGLKEGEELTTQFADGKVKSKLVKPI